MAQQKQVDLSKILLAMAMAMAIVVLLFLAAGVYLKSTSSTVAEPVAVDNEGLKQPVKEKVELEDDAVVGFKPF